MDECIESDIVFKWTYCCRLCLTSNASIDIFESESVSSDIMTKLRSYFKIVIYPGDPMPQKLCNVCMDHLNSWDKFKLKCIEADVTLKKRLLPFKSLDFVRIYLEQASKPDNESSNVTTSIAPFPTLAVKEEPLYDVSMKNSEASSRSASDSGQVGNERNGTRDWVDNDNSADTVYDEVPCADASGLDILRQMANDNASSNFSHMDDSEKSAGLSECAAGSVNMTGTDVGGSPLLIANIAGDNEIVAAYASSINLINISARPNPIVETRVSEHTGSANVTNLNLEPNPPLEGNNTVEHGNRINEVESTDSRDRPLLDEVQLNNHEVFESVSTQVDYDHQNDKMIAESCEFPSASSVSNLESDTREVISHVINGQSGVNKENDSFQPAVNTIRIKNLVDFVSSTVDDVDPVKTVVANDQQMLTSANEEVVENVAIDEIDIKLEPGLLLENAESKSYNLRRRRNAHYGDGEDWSEDAPGVVLTHPLTRQRVTPWKCEVCSIYFSSSQNLADHHSSDQCIGAQMDCFPCVICAKKFFSEVTLAEHNVRHVKVAFNLSVDELQHCRKCDLTFADTLRLERHDICHAQKSIPTQATQYSCDDCGLVFIKRATYDEHKKTHHITQSSFEQASLILAEVVQDRSYACSLCISTFKSEDLLYDHRFAFHGIPDERLVCTICSSKFRDATLLAQHMNSHQSRRTARKTTTPFLKIVDLRTLEKEPQSLAEGSVRCRRCGMVFSSREELTRHEAQKHKNLNPYWCRKCNRKFPTRSLLLMHHREHASSTSSSIESEATAPVDSSRVLPFIVGMNCHSCALRFVSKEDLQLHITSHRNYSNQKTKFKHDSGVLFKYHCSGCPQLFRQNKSIDKHSLKRHDGRRVDFVSLHKPISRKAGRLQRYQCTVCGSEFQCQASLNFHTKIKHRNPPVTNASESAPAVDQECPHCFKMFAVLAMDEHIAFAHKDKPKNRKCRMCPRICSNSHNLSQHEKSHSQNSVVKCRFCRKTFPLKYKSNCRKHEESCRRTVNNVAMTPPTPPRSAPLPETSIDCDFMNKCTICGNLYDTQSLLELHTMTAHGLISFKQTSTKERELWQEEDNKIMREIGGVQRCTLCQIQLDSAEAMSWHRSHHPRGNLYILQIDGSLFQCTVCDQLFTARKEAMRHAIDHAHLDVKPELPNNNRSLFKCPFCSSQFSSEDSIRGHIFYEHPSGSSKPI